MNKKLKMFKIKKGNGLTWPQKILFGIGIFILFYLSSKLVVALFLKWKKKEDKRKDIGDSENLVIDFLKKIIGITIILIGLYVSLSFIGMDMSTILVFLGSAGLGIALALKDFIASCVNGIIIITLNYYKVGDLVKFGELLGNVKSFNLVNTIVETSDGILHVIPNSKIVTDGYQSYSKNELISATVEACISNSNPKVNINKILREFSEIMKKLEYNESQNVGATILTIDENGTKIVCNYYVKPENYFKGLKTIKLALRDYLRVNEILLCNIGSRYLIIEEEN